MATHSEAAPSEFAEAARSTFIYAPIAAVVGTALVAIGAGIDSGFPVILGVVAYIAAAVAGLTGITGMIREGQDLLARQHEAAGLAIASYQSAAKGMPGGSRNGGAGGQPAVAAAPQVAPYAAAGPAGSSPAPSAASEVAPVPTAEAPVDPAALGAAERGADLGQASATDAADFVGLLKSLYILDAARDVQRLYGNFVCASFVNRKCAENGMPHVNLAGTDIPAEF